ncbi:hypothetical protein J5839_04515 [Methanosarcinaceae archaeon]|nr:hypothetical protein [Methanosarcinaceae archaeon]
MTAVRVTMFRIKTMLEAAELIILPYQYLIYMWIFGDVIRISFARSATMGEALYGMVGLIEKLIFYPVMTGVLIGSVIIYFAVSHKHRLKKKILFRGASFALCVSVMMLSIVTVYGNMDMRLLMTLIYTFPFLLLFYAYVLFSENPERPDRFTKYMIALTGILFLILSVWELFSGMKPVALICLILYGVYFAGCLIVKMPLLSVRLFSWTVFLPTQILWIQAILVSLTRHNELMTGGMF